MLRNIEYRKCIITMYCITYSIQYSMEYFSYNIYSELWYRLKELSERRLVFLLFISKSRKSVITILKYSYGFSKVPNLKNYQLHVNHWNMPSILHRILCRLSLDLCVFFFVYENHLLYYATRITIAPKQLEPPVYCKFQTLNKHVHSANERSQLLFTIFWPVISTHTSPIVY